MGNRVKGRTKKKSVRAAKSSSMGSARKLSRMGKKQKKVRCVFIFFHSFSVRLRCPVAFLLAS